MFFRLCVLKMGVVWRCPTARLRNPFRGAGVCVGGVRWSAAMGAVARIWKRQCAQWDPHMRMCAAFL